MEAMDLYHRYLRSDADQSVLDCAALKAGSARCAFANRRSAEDIAEQI
jgi:hypothetical protein